MDQISLNIFGEPLQPCSLAPLTGFYRDGCCATGTDDTGRHVVCAIMTADFLAFSQSKGNDLSTPRPEYNFPRLQPDDRWCLCVLRWKEAFESGVAPLVVLESTNEAALRYVDIQDLIAHASKREVPKI